MGLLGSEKNQCSGSIRISLAFIKDVNECKNCTEEYKMQRHKMNSLTRKEI